METQFKLKQIVWINLYHRTKKVIINEIFFERGDEFIYNGVYAEHVPKIKYVVKDMKPFDKTFYSKFPEKWTYYEVQNEIFATEMELVKYTSGNIYVTSKKCLKSELKYLEREEKLKKILNENI